MQEIKLNFYSFLEGLLEPFKVDARRPGLGLQWHAVLIENEVGIRVGGLKSANRAI